MFNRFRLQTQFNLKVTKDSGGGDSKSVDDKTGDSVKVVKAVPKLKLSSPGIPDAQRTSHGAAVAVNDDWDNGNVYAAPAPVGHREGEPIWDLDYLKQTNTEDDLLKITLSLTPINQAGNVLLEATTGGPLIRLWPLATKGTQADIIALPATIPANSLPKDYFVEGLKHGKVELKASYPSDIKTHSDKLVINVVDLQEKQGGDRKVIYTYDDEIEFEVLGGPANYTYDWDLDGNRSYNTAAYETYHKDKNKAKVKYCASEGNTKVKLVSNIANKRKIYDVAVEITGGLKLHTKARTTLGGVTTRGIRVALPTFQGNALPAKSTVGLHTRYAWTDNIPVTFSAVTAGVQIALNTGFGIAAPAQGANRIQYTANAAVTYASTLTSAAPGAGKLIFMVAVGDTSWTNGERSEDLDATVNHEIRHLRQYQSVRDNNPVNNVWRLLDNQYHAIPAYVVYLESEAYLSELMDINVGWRHQTHSGPALTSFVQQYNAAQGRYNILAVGTVRTSARQLLQRHYRDIPFEEMKRTGYDRSVRAPL